MCVCVIQAIFQFSPDESSFIRILLFARNKASENGTRNSNSNLNKFDTSYEWHFNFANEINRNGNPAVVPCKFVFGVRVRERESVDERVLMFIYIPYSLLRLSMTLAQCKHISISIFRLCWIYYYPTSYTPNHF